VLLRDNGGSGSINVGTPGETDTGTLNGGLADTVVVDNSANVTLSGLIINNMAGFTGVEVTKNTPNTMTVNMNDLTINDGVIGIEVMGGAGAGALNMTINDTMTEDATDVGVSFTDVDAGTIQINDLVVDGMIAGADGVRLTDSSATFTFNGLDIDTTTGDAFTSTDGGTVNFAGTTSFSSTTGDAFTMDGGTLSVSGTSTINTTTGVGLTLTDLAIGTAAFTSVNVTNGATSAIVMTNVTGGQVSIGSTTGTPGSGGTLDTAGDAIVLTNVQNVDLRQITITNTGGEGVNIDHQAAATTSMDVTIDGLVVTASTGDAINVLGADSGTTFNLRLTDSTITDSQIEMDITNSSTFNLLVENNTVTTTAAGDVTFSLAFSGAAQNADVTIRNNTFDADDASAFDMAVSGTNADVDFLFDNNTLSNASNVAASQTGRVVVSGGAVLDANVVNNDISNSGTADRFFMESDGSTTRINLDIVNNSANGDYELVTSNNGGGFNFGVVDRDTADANNIGNVNFTPLITDFEDIMGPVEMPNSSF
jgi:hypothetical protein